MTQVEMIVCITCRIPKPRSEYHANRTKRSGIQAACKPCQAQRNYANAGRWRETRRRYDRTVWKRRNRTAHRCRLTKERYLAKLAEQDRCCGICREPLRLGPDDMPSRWAVIDHDHKTNQFRGILCSKCNLVLGYIEMEGWLAGALAHLGRVK